MLGKVSAGEDKNVITDE
jgi:hypothetical protein